jgi:hypothetical protein
MRISTWWAPNPSDLDELVNEDLRQIEADGGRVLSVAFAMAAADDEITLGALITYLRTGDAG